MRAREGFTLVEVLVSLVLLAVVFMTLTGAAARYAHGVSRSEARASALLLVNDRLEELRLHPRYDELDRFAVSELDAGGVPGAVRATDVRRQVDTVGTGIVDFTTITVRVTRPGLVNPVARTTIVGAP